MTTYSDEAERRRHTREIEMQRIDAGKAGPLAEDFATNVVGVSFVPSWPRNLYALEELSMATTLLGDEQIPVVLQRRPDNPHDSNAIEVHVPALGELAFVGHLPRAVAARLAPHLDAGERWLAEVGAVRIHPDHPEHPGLTVRCWRP